LLTPSHPSFSPPRFLSPLSPQRLIGEMNNTQLLRLNWWQRSQASVPINLLSFSCVQENGIFEMPSAETLHGCAVRRLHSTYFLWFLQPFLKKCLTHYTFDSRCISFFTLSLILSLRAHLYLSLYAHPFLPIQVSSNSMHVRYSGRYR
jgi:hypothetical protein